MTDQLVRCEDLTRAFGAVTAVRDVSCAVLAGERIALTGPSGSGKSTLLHLMAGLETPTGGGVEWPVLGGHPHGRPGLVGVVFQGSSLLPALDVTENVALPLLFAGVPASEATARAVEALERLRIADMGSKLPEELSGGQAQRVAVARVLAARPPLILADEPTGQLDRATAVAVVDALIEAAHQSGAALVVATHDPAVASRLAIRWSVTDGHLITNDPTT
jgi:putative ABC transport system ATP-binding protein